MLQGEYLIRDKAFWCGSIRVDVTAFDTSYSPSITNSFNLTRNDSCGGHGTCKENQCLCDLPYSGEECDVIVCDCNDHGNCSDTGSSTCICDEGYFGANCNITTCYGIFSNETKVCNGRSYSCWPKNHCNCTFHETKYFGHQCEVTKCFDIFSNDSKKVCSGHGNCTEYNQCQTCDENYFGTYCNTTYCFGVLGNDSSVCNSHGKCSDLDICHCNENQYFGIYCNITTCNGVLNNQSNDIQCNNGKGNCTSFNHCDCVDDWEGQFCTITRCNNITSDKIYTTCSGHGTCVAPNVCECTDPTEYSGSYCNLWTCFSIGMLNSSFVCGNGHGTCIDRNKCACKRGYAQSVLYGECDLWECSGILMNEESTVCSGRGKCVDADECQCEGKYLGDDCENWNCVFDYKLSTTCSGHGRCLSPDTCECNSGYVGEYCGTNILYYVVMTPLLTVFGICVTGFILFSFCCICFVCCIGVSFLCVSMCLLLCVVGKQQLGIKKFKKLKNFDLLLQEQKMDEDDTIAKIRFNTKLFELSFDEIKTVRILGQGGSNSIVFSAIWNGQDCAFKCFRTRSLTSSQDRFDEFEREVEILSSLAHPNIIRFFGACLKPPRVGILMELCSKGEIHQFYDEFRQQFLTRYPIYEKIRMMIEIASALEYLHKKNIIHRDMKCENVLVSEDEHAKVMDFGLSRLVERMSIRKTKKIGTNVYMAPEIMLSEKYDEKCDVFSFAITVFIMLTENNSPYDDGDLYGIEMRVSQDPLYRPNLSKLDELDDGEENIVPPEISDWMKKLIRICWNHDPEKRYGCKKIRQFLESKLLKLDMGNSDGKKKSSRKSQYSHLEKRRVVVGEEEVKKKVIVDDLDEDDSSIKDSEEENDSSSSEDQKEEEETTSSQQEEESEEEEDSSSVEEEEEKEDDNSSSEEKEEQDSSSRSSDSGSNTEEETEEEEDLKMVVSNLREELEMMKKNKLEMSLEIKNLKKKLAKKKRKK